MLCRPHYIHNSSEYVDLIYVSLEHLDIVKSIDIIDGAIMINHTPTQQSTWLVCMIVSSFKTHFTTNYYENKKYNC